MDIQIDLTDQDLRRMQAAGMVAVDCEMAGLNPYRDPLYQVQLCDPAGEVRVLRAKDWQAASNFAALLADPRVVKVFHFAIMDCAFLFYNVGFLPTRVYCTKIASKLARTYSSSHSLSTLMDEFLGIKMDKKQQTSFWGRQEITAEQVEYAVLDVRHLLAVRDQLERILDEKGSLPTGITYRALNESCQSIIPTLVHLWCSGWDFGKEDPNSVFGK